MYTTAKNLKTGDYFRHAEEYERAKYRAVKVELSKTGKSIFYTLEGGFTSRMSVNTKLFIYERG